MDTLEILERAQKRGGDDRRKAILNVVLKARELNCDFTPSSSKAGGFNIRYGAIRYAVMDLNTDGEVYVHIKHHPSKGLSDANREKANEFVNKIDGITIKNAPINHYGQIEEPIEEIPAEAICEFLEFAVQTIRDRYYKPHFE